MMEKGVFMIRGIFFAETYSDALMVMIGRNCKPPLNPITIIPIKAELRVNHENKAHPQPFSKILSAGWWKTEDGLFALLYNHEMNTVSAIQIRITYQKSLMYCGSMVEISEPSPKRLKKSEVVRLSVYL